jgi:restriction system protein
VGIPLDLTSGSGLATANALNLFVQLWPLWLIVAVVLLGRAAKFVWAERQLRRSGIREIDVMDGPTFEHRLAILFRGLGYRVEQVGATHGDFGGDLIVAKDGKRMIVQAKRWTKNIGVKAVQEAVGARGFYKTDTAMVVANREFTAEARKLAHANDVTLWGREILVGALLRTAGRRAHVADAATESDLRTSVVTRDAGDADVGSPAQMFCARCGKPVSDRVRDYCLFHRERFAGLIYCYDDQRSV